MAPKKDGADKTAATESTEIEKFQPGMLTVSQAEKMNAALASLLESATAQWGDEQTGFPPYWAPGFSDDAMSPGWIGVVVGVEPAKTDTDFERWIITPTFGSVVCKKGPSDDADLIEVKPGEFFTMSNYSSLNLQPYTGCEVAVIPQRKRDIGKGRDLWDWRLKISKESKAKMLERLESLRAQQVQSPAV